MAMPLEGIRIVDFTDFIAGAYGTMLLAAYGAEVIRVESQVHKGFREVGPTGYKGSGVTPKKMRELPVGSIFNEFNRGKLSISLNMSTLKGRNLAKQLIKISDVVIDNFRFGVMQKWELEYPSLKQIKSDIIAVCLQPMGVTGPHKEWSCWGNNLMSFTGFTYQWSHPDASEVVGYQGAYVDYVVAAQTAFAIIAALLYRARTGKGQLIDLSQAEVSASLLGPVYMDYLVNSRNMLPRGNRHPQFAPYNCYRCKGKDSWCVIAVFNDDEWQHFLEALGHPPWAEEPKFKDMESRLNNVEELDKNIERWTQHYTPHQVMRILQGFSVAAGVVQNGEHLYHDLQLRARGFLVEHELPRLGRVTYPGIPLHLSDTPDVVSKRAPLLGEHNDYVYQGLLGLSPEEINTLVQERVIL
ncbi:CaiB/BaiF CoA transferase family protein [Chloroflexota bacterium]